MGKDKGKNGEGASAVIGQNGTIGGNAKQELKAAIERIERLEEEKKQLSDDIRDVYAEYKGKGFDVKTMRKAVAERKLTPQEREERDALLDTYMHALGDLAGTGLGNAARVRAELEAADEVREKRVRKDIDG